MDHAALTRDALFSGINSLPVPDSCGALIVCGPHASVVVSASAEASPLAIVAASSMNKGRVVAFAHDELLSIDDESPEDRGTFVRNSISWAAHSKQRPTVLVHEDNPSADWLREQGFSIATHSDALSQAIERKHDVILCNDSALRDEDRAAITRFVERGGGLLIAATGWAHPHYGAKRNGHPVRNPPSLLLASAGIIWDESECLPGDGDDVVELERDDARDEQASVTRTIEALSGWLEDPSTVPEEPEALRAALRRTIAYLRAAPRFGVDCSALFDSIHAAFEREEITVSLEQTLAQDQAWRRALVALQTERWRQLAADEQEQCPSACEYPGEVPDDAERVEREVRFDTAVARWVSTGVYAAPGAVIELSADEASLARGLRVRIGAHVDELFGDEDRESGFAEDAEYSADETEWKRWPELSFSWPLDEETTRVASPFGGLVYVIVASDGEGEPRVTVRGGVAAPRFVLDETSVFDWKSSIRDAPAPWGELECDKIIFTLPSSALRAVDDPEAVLRLWRRVMLCFEELGGVAYRRPERIVGDVQPSLGYLHSGYPIIGLLDDEDAALLIVLDRRKLVSDGQWGVLHELGHNVQQDAWTFEGTDEVTNNVFVLFVMDVLCGIAPLANPMLAEGIETARKYLQKSKKFAKWKEDPFLALSMYADLQRAFGWRPFIEVFAEYRTLAEEQQPKDDDDKRDQWLQRLSRACGHNLGPYFQAWGVPTSERARASLRDLPAFDRAPLEG
ncbi:MAG: M60 family metallopeptidase [Polyangiales bacterium]